MSSNWLKLKEFLQLIKHDIASTHFLKFLVSVLFQKDVTACLLHYADVLFRSAHSIT